MDAFKKLIVSMQFHDITRQQVEHVIGVLRCICSESAREDGGISRGPGGTAAVLALQASQLADAGEKFAASVASVAHNLDDIAAHVLEMADQSRALSGLSEDEKNSFFLQMERGFTAILAGLTVPMRISPRGPPVAAWRRPSAECAGLPKRSGQLQSKCSGWH